MLHFLEVDKYLHFLQHFFPPSSLFTSTPTNCCNTSAHIHLLSSPILTLFQVLANAIQQASPREDSTRIGSGGVARRQVIHATAHTNSHPCTKQASQIHPFAFNTSISSASSSSVQAVDVSPLRRVNKSLSLITTGAREAAFRNIKTIAE